MRKTGGEITLGEDGNDFISFCRQKEKDTQELWKSECGEVETRGRGVLEGGGRRRMMGQRWRRRMEVTWES
jgi:hypothetical protein